MKSNKLLSGLIFSGIIVFNIGLFAEESIDLDQLKKKLVKAVLAGELTGEKARAKYQEAESGGKRDSSIAIAWGGGGLLIRYAVELDILRTPLGKLSC